MITRYIDAVRKVEFVQVTPDSVWETCFTWCNYKSVVFGTNEVERMSLSAIRLKVGAILQSIFKLLSLRLCWPLKSAEVIERSEYSRLSLKPSKEFSIDAVSMKRPVRVSPFQVHQGESVLIIIVFNRVAE